MVQSGQNELTDSEIIALLGEYNFDEREIGRILGELESREFEGVMEYIQTHRQGEDADREMDDRLEEIRRRNEIRKLETERLAEYKNRLIEKIRSNREERQKKTDAELKEMDEGPVKATVAISAPVRVKAIIKESEEVVLGFERESTMNDLFRELKKILEKPVFTVRRFGHTTALQESEEKIVKTLGAEFGMLEVDY